MRHLANSLFAILLVVLLPGAAAGQSKIENAFGQKLGERFRFEESPMGDLDVEIGLDFRGLRFLPPANVKPVRYCDAFRTPSSLVVFAVVGEGEVENQEVAKSVFAQISEAVQKKYGTNDVEKRPGLFRLSQGSRSIEIKILDSWDQEIGRHRDPFGIHKSGTAKIVVTYLDKDLKKLAESERDAVEAAKVAKKIETKNF